MKLTPVPVPSGDLKPHPLSRLLPPMSQEDFSLLVADIKANGMGHWPATFTREHKGSFS
jgi:hypothetical protein